MLQAAPLIPLSLALTVVLDQFRVRLATLFLILGMLAPPLLLAVARLGDIPGQSPVSCGDNRRGAGIGTPAGCRPFVGGDKQRQNETLAVRTAARLAQAYSSGIVR